MWIVEIGLRQGPPGTREELRSFLDEAYAELCRLSGILDPEMSAVLANNEYAFSVVIDTEDRQAAIDTASAAIRSALHHAGAHTPEWTEQLEAALARSRVSSEPVAA